MNAEFPYPLNEPQRRRLTITLAGLETQLAALRQQLERRPPDDLCLTRYEDVIRPRETSLLLPAIRVAEARLREMAHALRLPVLSQPVRRTFVAALELARINLYECRPRSGLAGFGQVAPLTAEYLEREIPRLETALQSLIALLQKADINAPT